ncbi:MAG: hypothetical protein WCV86_03990 [Patescibacteria group bacterium]|jgi:Tol biopolymer transport system component
MNRSRLQTLLYLAAFIITVLLFIFAIYWLFFRTAPSTNTNDNANENVNGLPNVNAANFNVNGNANANIALPNVNTTDLIDRIAQGGFTQTNLVTENAVIAPSFGSNDQDLVFYDTAEDKFYRRTQDGRSQTLLTEETFPEVESIAWSPTGDRAVLTFPDDTKLYYNFATQEKATLPKELNDISFSQQGTQIASKFVGSETTDTWLTVSNPDGTGAEILESLGENESLVDVNWSPTQQVVATYHRGTSFDAEEVIFLGKEGENFPSVNVPGRGFEGIWSSDGRKMLYSVYAPETRNVPQIYFMDASGDNFGTNHQTLALETWADKCTFSLTGTNVYCAVPNFLPSSSGFDRALALGIPDDIYKIDLINGRADRIATPVDSRGLATVTASDLLVSPAEDVLYFKSESDGKVYTLNLR